MPESPQPSYPISAGFRYTAEENSIAQNLFLRYSSMGRKLRSSMFTVGPLATGAGLVSLFHPGRFFPIGFLFLFVGVFILSMPVWMRRAIRLQFDKLPHRNQSVAWQIFPDHMEGKTPVSSFSFAWCVVSQALIAEKGCILYPTQNTFHWLPAHAFSTPEDFAHFTELVASEVADCRRVP
jgi:hypothetical protein